jgi:thiamine biosynthesis lipoprotein
MKQERALMGMPISVEVVDPHVREDVFDQVYDYFKHVDEKFSTYKKTSEITAINEGRISIDEASEEMRLIFALSKETEEESGGFFNIKTPNGTYDPSGLVKGWAIWNAAQIILKAGFNNFYVDAGGDIQPHGVNGKGEPWTVGIKNPWNEVENIKIIKVATEGVATSGIYIRGLHIYDPHTHAPIEEIVSLTVIGQNIYEADRFATAAFAMGKKAIHFIEALPGLEGYMIDNDKIATMTTGFEKYAVPAASD